MADLVGSFMGDEIVDEQVDGLTQMRDEPVSLIVMDATAGEAKRLEKQAYAQAGSLFDTLREIHERKAFLHLGATSFDHWYSGFRAKVKHVMDITTFYRQLAHREVTQVLTDAGIDARGINQHHAAVLNKLPPGMIPEAVETARQKAREYEPTGKAAEFHHPGKVLTSFVEEAVAERIEKFADETPDPFDDGQAEADARPDFFAARTPVQSAKPLPPKQASAPLSPVDRPLADFICCEYKPGADVIFISFRVAPGEEYESWVPVGKIREALK